jgi:hypothetical protein
MDRRDALHKATVDTPAVGSAALLPLQVGRRFLVQIKDQEVWGQRINQDIVTAPTGQLNKFNTSNRIIRKAEENSDDGYRVGANFPTVAYATVKIRLPWEVTEDVFHENIAGESLEATITNDMTKQFALDLADLEVNGDETSGNAFLQINRGILRELALNGLHRVNGGAINAGVLAKSHFFAGAKAMPNKYRAQEGLVWIMSPNRHLDWIEKLTDRATSAGDSALIAQGPPVDKPLGIPVFEHPQFPDDRIVLAAPSNFHRVVSWQIRRRRVTGETDAQLAALDKRFYVYFLKHDCIIEEHDAIVDIYGLAAI